jgi:hypothetical protein
MHKELKTTDNGRAVVASVEFAARITAFMRDCAAARKTNAVVCDNVIRMIALALCEIDPEYGPPVDSPELQNSVWEHQDELPLMQLYSRPP